MATAAPAHDVTVLRDLVKQYAEIAHAPEQRARRELWRAHLSMTTDRVPVLTRFGMHNVWCREVFGDDRLDCEDPFFRAHERRLKMALFQGGLDDDAVLEPWIDQRAAIETPRGGTWGVKEAHIASGVEGGAWKFDPPIRQWSDIDKLVAQPHRVGGAETERVVGRLQEAVGDILPVNVHRSSIFSGFNQDISTRVTRLRGLEQLMIDMMESPDELHQLLAFMRDAILANQQQCEDAGDYSLTSGSNQCMTYCDSLPDPKPNTFGVKRADLWGYFAAQEFTLISPAMHEEFLLQYQRPIMAPYGLTAYGCCEDLTRKIDMLRSVPNLRIIAVTPRANIDSCAGQIGRDYVISWRPNPTDMVCCGWNEQRVRRIVRHALEVTEGQCMHISLKDIETLEGDTDRLARWVRVVRQEVENAGRR